MRHYVYNKYKDECMVVETIEFEKMLESGEWVDSPAKRCDKKEKVSKRKLSTKAEAAETDNKVDENVGDIANS